MSYVTQRFIPGYRTIDGSDLNSLVDQVNAGPGSGPTYYVNNTIGKDDLQNDGFSPYKPLKTLDRALALESAALVRTGLSSVGRNAIIAFWGTQPRTSTLAWNLPGTHLVGLCAPQLRAKRARISVTGSTGFNNLVSVTAQGCSFSNFGTFYGWVDASTALRCWSDTAGRSSYDNVEFLGFGDQTASTGSSNLTGSRAFYMSTDNGETTWRNCVFGVDTTVRNATNYTIEIAGAAPRLSFIDCVWESMLGASGGSAAHMLVGVGGTDRYIDIVRGRFHNFPGGTAMAQALNVSVSAGGTIFLDQTSFGPGITAIQTTPTANVVMNMTSPSAGGGVLIQNAP